MSDEPSTPAGNGDGRGPGGRFGPGNNYGRGNPNNARAQQLRNALLTAVTAGDIKKCLSTIRTVMDEGKPSERLAAAEALLDRMLGKPVPADLLERIEALEATMEQRRER